ncbi:hypothetical protein TNCT_695661 [Trichonephila clavata]|uniref:Uncharacterized protein n=1 Tax=Trichonephila clavata TaxID=2740835 RepID=A0A8X6KK04_TRICU|nr:hypothetical protein TNCT_695661 [Trichonephila clavata]
MQGSSGCTCEQKQVVFLITVFYEKGPSKSNPEIENGGDSKTRSGGKETISWLPGRTVYFFAQETLT